MIETELSRHGYWFVFAGTIVEGDATLLTAAFLAHRGYFRLPWVMMVAALSALTASHSYFLLARRHGVRLLETAGKGAKAGRIIAWSRQRGALLLIASRFMIGFRTLIPVVCGATGMSASRFFLWNAIGAVLWSVALGFAGYLGGHLLSVVVDDIRRHERVLAAMLAIGGAGFVLWKTRGRDLRDIWVLGTVLGRRDTRKL